MTPSSTESPKLEFCPGKQRRNEPEGKGNDIQNDSENHEEHVDDGGEHEGHPQFCIDPPASSCRPPAQSPALLTARLVFFPVGEPAKPGVADGLGPSP
jgi:hypothetical protein